jgi:hypothetical protein
VRERGGEQILRWEGDRTGDGGAFVVAGGSSSETRWVSPSAEDMAFATVTMGGVWATRSKGVNGWRIRRSCQSQR